MEGGGKREVSESLASSLYVHEGTVKRKRGARVSAWGSSGVNALLYAGPANASVQVQAHATGNMRGEGRAHDTGQLSSATFSRSF